MLTEANRQSRGKALEEAFFFRMDQELIELLGKRMQRDEKMRSFANATGIQDKKRLASLIDAGFELSTLTAFIWVPLVFVAWADGHADQQGNITADGCNDDRSRLVPPLSFGGALENVGRFCRRIHDKLESIGSQ
jgi:hypothetical protein